MSVRLQASCGSRLITISFMNQQTSEIGVALHSGPKCFDGSNPDRSTSNSFPNASINSQPSSPSVPRSPNSVVSKVSRSGTVPLSLATNSLTRDSRSEFTGQPRVESAAISATDSVGFHRRDSSVNVTGNKGTLLRVTYDIRCRRYATKTIDPYVVPGADTTSCHPSNRRRPGTHDNATERARAYLALPLSPSHSTRKFAAAVYYSVGNP
jgi:hypothetical protein